MNYTEIKNTTINQLAPYFNDLEPTLEQVNDLLIEEALKAHAEKLLITHRILSGKDKSAEVLQYSHIISKHWKLITTTQTEISSIFYMAQNYPTTPASKKEIQKSAKTIENTIQIITNIIQNNNYIKTMQAEI